MGLRRCSGPCGCEFPEDVFFRKNKVGQMRLTRAVCIGCETTKRTEEKQRDRTRVKAQDTIRRHAKKWGLTSQELCEGFGWVPEQIKHDIEHAAKNGCPYCRRPFASMVHGLADITIDIVDPTKKPFYTTNTKIACITCNREKCRTSPETWAHKLICWDKWERAKDRRSSNPMAGCPLWDWAA